MIESLESTELTFCRQLVLTLNNGNIETYHRLARAVPSTDQPTDRPSSDKKIEFICCASRFGSTIKISDVSRNRCAAELITFDFF